MPGWLNDAKAVAPLRALATLVGYSRVHTGVHYPAEVLAGAFIGVTAAELAGRAPDARLRTSNSRFLFGY